MIIFITLFIITALLLLMGVLTLSIGGTFFTFIFADVIVAVFILWFLFFRRKKNK